MHAFQHRRPAIQDIEAEGSGMRQGRKRRSQFAEHLGRRGGRDHLFTERVQQPHLFAERRHAVFAEPPDGSQGAGQNQCRQQDRGLDHPTSLQQQQGGRARNQNLEIMVIGRQRTVLACDAGDANPVTRPEAVELRAGIPAGAGKKDAQVLRLFIDREQVSARILVFVSHHAVGGDEHA